MNTPSENRRKKPFSELFRPNAKRAKIAIIGLSIVVALAAVLIVSDVLELLLLKRISNGDYTIEETNQSDKRQQILSILYLAFFIVNGILFMQWFRRAYYNLSKIKETEHNDDWAIWGWIIPIANLFRPYQIMRELVSYARSVVPKITEKSTPSSFSMLPLWWGCWIISSIFARVGANPTVFGQDIDAYITSSYVSIFTSVVNFAAGALLIWIVYDYSEIEKEYVNVQEIDLANFGKQTEDENWEEHEIGNSEQSSASPV